MRNGQHTKKGVGIDSFKICVAQQEPKLPRMRSTLNVDTFHEANVQTSVRQSSGSKFVIRAVCGCRGMPTQSSGSPRHSLPMFGIGDPPSRAGQDARIVAVAPLDSTWQRVATATRTVDRLSPVDISMRSASRPLRSNARSTGAHGGKPVRCARPPPHRSCRRFPYGARISFDRCM